jgi:hypothetical protein
MFPRRRAANLQVYFIHFSDKKEYWFGLDNVNSKFWYATDKRVTLDNWVSGEPSSDWKKTYIFAEHGTSDKWKTEKGDFEITGIICEYGMYNSTHFSLTFHFIDL